MEFILDEYHKNVSDEEILEEMRMLAKKLGKDTISQSEWIEYSRFSVTIVTSRFGSFNAGKEKAGLKIMRQGFNELSLKYHEYCESDDVFIEDVKSVANQLHSDYISLREYRDKGRYNPGKMTTRLGGWSEILKRAGLKTSKFNRDNHFLSNEDLFKDIEQAWIRKGKQPTASDASKGLLKYSASTYTHRFGSWRKALEAFVAYVNTDETDGGQEDSEKNKQIEATPLKGETPVTSNAAVCTHKTSRNINLRLRFRVLARDHFKCCCCGKSPATNPSVELHVDHIFPWSKGGETVKENLQTLCSECNLGKSDLTDI